MTNATINTMSKKSRSLAAQLSDLTARRADLANELKNCAPAMHGTDWHRDRVNEMAYLNRSAQRIAEALRAEAGL